MSAGYGGGSRCDYCKVDHRPGETCGRACEREHEERIELLKRKYPNGIPPEELDWAMMPLRW